jgi:hypothetical protein
VRDPNLEQAFWETSMSSKKKITTTPGTSSQALKIGSRVRCTGDGVEGRIVWANAVSVKIRWDDGEQITWRRDSLSDRPLAILGEGSDEDQPESPMAPDALASTDQTESVQPEPEESPTTPAPASPEQSAAEAPAAFAAPELPAVEQADEVPSTESAEVPVTLTREQWSADAAPVEEAPSAETVQEAATPLEQGAGEPQVHSEPATLLRQKPKPATDGKEKRLSALDAAVKVLTEMGQAMSCQELITAMAQKGYWSSPGGKTPQATLYSAIARDITAKGAQSRFVKAQRGKFARNKAS